MGPRRREGERERAEVLEKWGEEHRMKELKSMFSNESYEWIAFERLPNAEKKKAGAWRSIVPSWEACACVYVRCILLSVHLLAKPSVPLLGQ